MSTAVYKTWSSTQLGKVPGILQQGLEVYELAQGGQKGSPVVCPLYLDGDLTEIMGVIHGGVPKTNQINIVCSAPRS